MVMITLMMTMTAWMECGRPPIIPPCLDSLCLCCGCVWASRTRIHTHARSHAHAQKRAQTFKLKYILVCTCVDWNTHCFDSASMCLGHAYTHTQMHARTERRGITNKVSSWLKYSRKPKKLLTLRSSWFKFIVVPGDKLKSCKVLNPIDGVDGKDATRQLDCDPLKRNQLCQK